MSSSSSSSSSSPSFSFSSSSSSTALTVAFILMLLFVLELGLSVSIGPVLSFLVGEYSSPVIAGLVLSVVGHWLLRSCEGSSQPVFFVRPGQSFFSLRRDMAPHSASSSEDSAYTPKEILWRRLQLTLRANESLASQRDFVRVELQVLKQSTPDLTELLELIDDVHAACGTWSGVLKGPSPEDIMPVVEAAEKACRAWSAVLDGPSPAEVMEVVDTASKACHAWSAVLARPGPESMCPAELRELVDLAAEACDVLDGELL